MKTLAVASILALGVAACSSSSSTPKSSNSSGNTSATGQPLVIVDNVGTAFTQTFNPYDPNSVMVKNNMQDLIYEPLMMFNMMNPTQAPIPWLASADSWSPDGKTLTLTIRQGVKWSDGQPLTASDVAFTFNLFKQYPAFDDSPAPNPSPVPDSATAPNATTAVLTFPTAQYSNLFLIGSTYILPQHIWSSVGDPTKYANANPVGTGPYVMSSFSTQKVVLKANPSYWQKSMVKVPEIIYPYYVSNDTSNPALFSGSIDYAGNFVTNVAQNFLGKADTNHTWSASAPYFGDNNVVGLFLNVTRGALKDPKVRQAISAGINRQQLSIQGESGYEPVATSSGGLMLPTDNSLLNQSLASDLPAAGNAAKVNQIMTSDGYTKSGGHWTKNGQPVKFAIQDPSDYTDYATDAQLIATQLNNLGFEVSFDGVQDNAWYSNYPVGNFDAMIHWGAQGASPFTYFSNWLDFTQSAAIGKTAGGDWERYSNPAAQTALTKFEGSNDSTTQQDALNSLQSILSTDAPVIPLLYGAAWYEYSTKKYTGWPTASNQYMNPVPNAPYVEYTILHLTPAS